jgi:hypothetical protein
MLHKLTTKLKREKPAGKTVEKSGGAKTGAKK